MAYATARTVRTDAIPVIDITALRDNSDVSRIASELHAASQGLGFIYVKGHGIPDLQIKSARRAAFEFFQASEENKKSVLVTAAHRGWLNPGASKMDDDVKADLKESFIWGAEDVPQDDHPLRGPNQWPAFLPELEEAAMTYFHSVQEVARVLLRGFAIGLNLEPEFFLKTSSRPLSRASFVYYPTQPADSGETQFGVGPHTDFGVLTVLCQDDTGGLQVQDVNGDWIHAPPIEGTLVVNVGDLLSRWTDGQYKSTPHRVVNTSGRERLSLVLAFDPDPETMIDAGEIPGLAPKDDPITCGDYLVWRFAKAFSYRQQDRKT